MDLDIWAFVRVMVFLEEQGGASALFAAWAEDWAEVDARLTELAQSDFAAYSEMMMQSQIELALASAHHQELHAALAGVIAELQAKKAASTDPGLQKDLRFEIAGLTALHESLQ